MAELLVEMTGISKSFPGVHALDDARFDLRAGEVHALVGENGAGKSTLMKILAGIYHRDAGTITVKGREVEIPSPRAAQDLGISIIHQELNLMGHLSVAQNIFIGREPRGRLLAPHFDRQRPGFAARHQLAALRQALGKVQGAYSLVLLTDPVTVAESMDSGEVTPLVQSLAGSIYDALRRLLKYL